MADIISQGYGTPSLRVVTQGYGGGGGPTPPIAAFTLVPLLGQAPLNVQFTDHSLNNPTTWLWDFGDGTTSTEQNPMHTYARQGKYIVSLTVTNNSGTSTATLVNPIVVGFLSLIENSGPQGGYTVPPQVIMDKRDVNALYPPALGGHAPQPLGEDVALRERKRRNRDALITAALLLAGDWP